MGKGNTNGPGLAIRGSAFRGALVASILALALSAAATAQAASIKAPQSVSVGKRMVLTIRGFPPNSAVVFAASLDGPAALSSRRLGQTRTDSSGRAILRTRFPATYRWCDADRKCSTYKWPAKARIALSAATKKSPHASARRIVQLRKPGRRGSKYRPCVGKVRLSAGDLATQIKAKQMSCRRAKKVIKAPATKLGYRCKTRKKDGLPQVTCTKGHKAVKFIYIQY